MKQVQIDQLLKNEKYLKGKMKIYKDLAFNNKKGNDETHQRQLEEDLRKKLQKMTELADTRLETITQLKTNAEAKENPSKNGPLQEKVLAIKSELKQVKEDYERSQRNMENERVTSRDRIKYKTKELEEMSKEMENGQNEMKKQLEQKQKQIDQLQYDLKHVTTMQHNSMAESSKSMEKQVRLEKMLETQRELAQERLSQITDLKDEMKLRTEQLSTHSVQVELISVKAELKSVREEYERNSRHFDLERTTLQNRLKHKTDQLEELRKN